MLSEIGIQMKTIAIKTNKNNIKYALMQDGEKFSVWKLCANYSANAKNGIVNTWRYVEKNMSFDDANTLFARRSK
jgi:hypothetical protein